MQNGEFVLFADALHRHVVDYESLTEDFRCCCGSVRSITEVEDLLGDILTKRPEK